jgi:hypothetical protein
MLVNEQCIIQGFLVKILVQFHPQGKPCGFHFWTFITSMRTLLESRWKEQTPETRLQALQNWDDEFFSFIDCKQWQELSDDDRWRVKETVKSWLEDLMRKLGDFGFDENHLIPGNVIVMWDGHFFGFYPDLDSAVQNCIERITDRRNCFSPPDDFECLEFMEVLDENAGYVRDMTGKFGHGCYNEHGIRVSYNYPVKELGNQVDRINRDVYGNKV